MGSVGTRVGGSTASVFLWSDLTRSTCWLSGTSTWTASRMHPHGTLHGTGTNHTLVHLTPGTSTNHTWHRSTQCSLTTRLSLPPCLSLSLRFDKDDHNCFSFCLRYVNSVLAAEGRSALTRETFTHSFILPRMKRVSKYTTVYQHIQRHQYYVVDRQEDVTTSVGQ